MLPRSLAKLARSCCLAAVFAALPATALADGDDDDDRGRRYRHDDRRDDRGDRYRHDDRDRDRACGRIGITIGGGGIVHHPAPPRVVEQRVWVEPVYRTVIERKWVPPVYRTVTERVWIEPVVRTIPDRKWVPDRYAWRDVVHYDHYGRRCIRRERVLVEPAHFVDCPRTVEIAPGRWEEHARQELVCEGRWEMCERQELVSAGYWTTRTVVLERERPHYESSHARLDLRIPLGR